LFKQFKYIYTTLFTRLFTENEDWVGMMKKWDGALQEFSDDEVQFALDECEKNSKFVPSISEFINYAQLQKARNKIMEQAKRNERLKLQDNRISSRENALAWIGRMKSALA
jgi:hypothetical protein